MHFKFKNLLKGAFVCLALCSAGELSAQIMDQAISGYLLSGRSFEQRLYENGTSSRVLGTIGGFGFQYIGVIKNWEYSAGLEFTDYYINTNIDEQARSVGSINRNGSLRLSAGRTLALHRWELGLHGLLNLGYNPDYSFIYPSNESGIGGSASMEGPYGPASVDYDQYASSPIGLSTGFKANIECHITPRFALEAAYRFELGWINYNRYDVSYSTTSVNQTTRFDQYMRGSNRGLELKFRLYLDKIMYD